MYLYYVLLILIDLSIYYFSMSILALVQWFYVCFIVSDDVHVCRQLALILSES